MTSEDFLTFQGPLTKATRASNIVLQCTARETLHKRTYSACCSSCSNEHHKFTALAGKIPLKSFIFDRQSEHHLSGTWSAGMQHALHPEARSAAQGLAVLLVPTPDHIRIEGRPHHLGVLLPHAHILLL